jgi:hypothetical protein
MYHLQLCCNYQQNQASISKKGTRQTLDSGKLAVLAGYKERSLFILNAKSGRYKVN